MLKNKLIFILISGMMFLFAQGMSAKSENPTDEAVKTHNLNLNDGSVESFHLGNCFNNPGAPECQNIPHYPPFEGGGFWGRGDGKTRGHTSGCPVNCGCGH